MACVCRKQPSPPETHWRCNYLQHFRYILVTSRRPCTNTRPTLLWLKREGPTCSLQILIQPEHFVCILKQSRAECCRFNSLIALWEVRQIQIPDFVKLNLPTPNSHHLPIPCELHLECFSVRVYLCANQKWVGVEKQWAFTQWASVLSCKWLRAYFFLKLLL